MASSTGSLKSKHVKADWIYSTLPINIALGPVGTFVQLYILELHGTVIDIALATTLFNAVTIPAAIIWGFTTDRSDRRKPIIVLSYVAVAATLILFVSARTIYGVDVLYSIFSLVSSAAATPLNMLIMETQPKSRWAPVFARLSMMSSVGVVIGLLLGVAWGDFLPFNLLVVPLTVLCVLSAAMSVVMIKEPGFVFERDMIVMVSRSFFQRLLALPLFFLKIPSLMDFRRFFKGGRSPLTREPALLYGSIAAFYFASGIFNTSLVPSLSKASISRSEIFLVSVIAMTIQTASFNYYGKRMTQQNLRQNAFGGLLLRSVGYVAIGVSAYFLTGLPYLAYTIVFYTLAAGLAYAVYYAASNVMVFSTLGRSGQGSALGIYSALVGFATMIGSFISGFISFYTGFYLTFLIAGLFMASGAVFIYLLSPSNPYSDEDIA
ncbi:MAG: MFS transporter [Candidatus Bathyarchaeia archaeon]